jgi:hypothetical protein
MEIFKKKILLEDFIDRSNNSPVWGVMPKDKSIYLNIMLTQTMDNMGIFADIEYSAKTDTSLVANYDILITKLRDLGISNSDFNFMGGGIYTTDPYSLTNKEILRIPQKPLSDYSNYPAINSLNFKITGYTDSKLEDLRSYDAKIPFKIGFDIERADYYNYVDSLVQGVSRIHSMGEPRIYVFDTPSDSTLGTPSQVNGLQYIEYTGQTREVILNDINSTIPITQFNYGCEGINMLNSSLSAITKEEYLFGIIFPPEVKSEVFIERGITSVMDKHLRLSEIKALNELSRYGNGFYKLNKQ